MHRAAGRAQRRLGAAGAHHRVRVDRDAFARRRAGCRGSRARRLPGCTRASCSTVACGACSRSSGRNSSASSARQHAAQPVGAFRVPRPGIVFQAGRVGDQGDGHGRFLGFLVRDGGSGSCRCRPPRSRPAGRGRSRGKTPGSRPPPRGRWPAPAAARPAPATRSARLARSTGSGQFIPLTSSTVSLMAEVWAARRPAATGSGLSKPGGGGTCRHEPRTDLLRCPLRHRPRRHQDRDRRARAGRRRSATGTASPRPAGYDATIDGIAGLVREAEQALGGAHGSVGIGIPGVISPVTGLVKNANSIALNGHPFDQDISARAAARGARRQRRQLLRAQRGLGRRGRGPRRGVRRHRRHRLRRRHHRGRPGDRGAATASPASGGTCRCPGRATRNCPARNAGAASPAAWRRFISGPALAMDCDGPDAHDASGIPARAAAGEQKAHRRAGAPRRPAGARACR